MEVKTMRSEGKKERGNKTLVDFSNLKTPIIIFALRMIGMDGQYVLDLI